jgi:hypothetical protein
MLSIFSAISAGSETLRLIISAAATVTSITTRIHQITPNTTPARARLLPPVRVKAGPDQVLTPVFGYPNLKEDFP